jgi:serine/threonine protein kinase
MELAFGDFTNLVNYFKKDLTEIIARSFFHQLVEGVEYLHKLKIAHLDIKLDNLLLGHDFKLKLTDFDNSHFEGDTEIRARGSKNYRAPELNDRYCEDCMAADIYSMGVVLFGLVTKVLPYSERQASRERISRTSSSRPPTNTSATLSKCTPKAKPS